VSTAELGVQLRASAGRSRWWTIAMSALLGVYLVLPMVVVLMASVTSGAFLQVPPDGFSLRWYDAVLADSLWTDALKNSLLVSGVGSAIAVVVSTLAVVGMARLRRGRRLLRPLFFLPMVLPLVVYALGLRQASLPLDLQQTLWPLMVGQAVIGLPIAFLSIAAGMRGVDPALRRAAASLGASWWRTVWQIELPLLRRSIVTGWVLSFAFCFDEVVLALFLAPPGRSTLPAKLYTEASQNVTPLIASVAGYVVLITVLLALVVGLVRRLDRRPTALAPTATSTQETP
jgi:putative spermidine/putrescine transport system permease protein